MQHLLSSLFARGSLLVLARGSLLAWSQLIVPMAPKAKAGKALTVKVKQEPAEAKAGKASTAKVKKEPVEEKPTPKANSAIMPAFRGLRTVCLGIPTVSMTCSARSEFYERFLSLENLQTCVYLFFFGRHRNLGRILEIGFYGHWQCMFGVARFESGLVQEPIQESRTVQQRLKVCSKAQKLAKV